MRLLQSVWTADEIFIAGWNASKVVVLRYAIRGVRGLTQEVIG